MSNQARDGDGVGTIKILGVKIAIATAAEMIERIRVAAKSGPTRVAYVNAHTLNLAFEDSSLRMALLHSHFVLNDGAGLSLAARLHGCAFPENLHGSDFNVTLLRMAAAEGWSVFLLGGRPGIADRAAGGLVRLIPGLRVVGTRHGFHSHRHADVQAVNASEADVLLVAMGNPLQELWLEEHFGALQHVRVGVGVGAFFDFQANAVPRAPQWMNDRGIEWLFRLAQEPRRLAKRYLLGNPTFVFRVLRERLSRAIAYRD